MEFVNPKYLTEVEVSKIIGIALSTLRNHRFLGKGIQYSKLGRSVRYSLADVLEYVESRKVKLTEQA